MIDIAAVGEIVIDFSPIPNAENGNLRYEAQPGGCLLYTSPCGCRKFNTRYSFMMNQVAKNVGFIFIGEIRKIFTRFHIITTSRNKFKS